MLNARLSSYGVRLPSQPDNQRLTEPEQCRALLREAGCAHIVVHTELYPPGEWSKIEARIGELSSLRLEYAEGAGRVYSLSTSKRAR